VLAVHEYERQALAGLTAMDIAAAGGVVIKEKTTGH